MGISHGHHHHHGAHNHCHGHAGRRPLAIAAILTGLFMVVEIIGGIVSGSLALLADAGHMMTDFAALTMAWGAFVLAERPATPRYTFGYVRLPVLAAFVNGLALFAISVFIIIEAARRFNAIEDYEIMAGTMFWVAVAGLVVNIIVFLILSRTDKENLNIRGALLHVIGDMLGSAAAIVAALVIMRTGYKPIDPILSVFVALLILRSAWFLIKDSGHILLEGTPKALVEDAIRIDLLERFKEIKSIDKMHIWSLADDYQIMTLTLHIKVKSGSAALIDSIKHHIAHVHGVDDITVEIK